MARQVSNYKKILKLLEQLHIDYPSFNIGRHLETALGEVGNLWGLADKEVLNYLEKYQEELAFDGSNIVDDAYVEKIRKGAENLFEDINQDYETD